MTARAIYTRIRQEYRAALRERAPFSDRRIRRYLRFQTESPRARAVRMLLTALHLTQKRRPHGRRQSHHPCPHPRP